MKTKPFSGFAAAVIFLAVIGLVFGGAVGASAAQSQPDEIATIVAQTVEAMVSPTPTVSIKDLKINILVQQTVEAYYTGTPTPLPKPENVETAIAGTLEAMKPAATLSAEDAEIAAAVQQTVMAILPSATPTPNEMDLLRQTFAVFSQSLTKTVAVSTVIPVTPVVPAATEITDPVDCEDAMLVSHVSIPDGTKLLPGQPFKKTWRIQNTGSCTSPWTPSHQLVYSRGERMNGLWGVHLTKNVSRGETVDISVDLTAPSAPGEYTGIWMMADGAGNVFGRQFQVRIAVVDEGLFACALVGTQPDGPGVIVTLKNTGTENWSGNDVDLVYSSGEAPTAETRLDLPGNVPPGGTVTFPKIDFNSGRTPGNSVWTLYNNAEAICSFGI